MTETVAYLEAVVGADITSFRRGMAEIRQSIFDTAGLGDQLQHIGAQMTMAITAPLLAMGGIAVHEAATFEAAMRNVNSILLLNEEDLASLSDETLRFGSTIRSGPIAAAEALYTVVSAGFTSAADAMHISQVAAATAEAGLADITTTTLALTSAMLAYSASTEEAEWYSNVLTRTVQVGVGTMDNFAGAFSRVNPTAALLGITFDQVGGALAYLTQRGISAEEASTALNGALLKLVTPTDTMRQAFDDLGVASGEELISKFGGLAGAMEALALWAGEDETKLRDMFNEIRAFKAAATFANDLDAFTQAMAQFGLELNGITDAARQQQLASFNAKIDLMRAALSGLAIIIGQYLIPVLEPMVVGFTDLIGRVAALPPEIIQLSIVFAGLVAAAGPALWLLGTLLNPINLLIGAVGALAFAFATDFGGIRSTIQKTLDSVSPNLHKLTGLVGEFFAILTEDVTVEPTVEVRPDVVPAPGMRADWEDAANTVTREVDQTFAFKLQRAIAAVTPKLQDAFRGVWNDLKTWITTTAIPTFDNIAGSVLRALSSAFTNAGGVGGRTPVYETFRKLMKGDLEGAINDIIPGLGTTLRDGLADTGALFPKIGEGIRQFAANFGNWLLNEGLPTLSRSVGYFVGRIGALIGAGLGSIFSGGGLGEAGGYLGKLWGEFTGGFEDALGDSGVATGGLKGAVDGLLTGLAGLLTGAAALNTFVGVLKGRGFLASLVGGVGLALSGPIVLVGGILSFATNVLTLIANSLIGYTPTLFGKQLTGLPGLLLSAITLALNTAKNLVVNVFTFASGAFTAIAQGVTMALPALGFLFTPIGAALIGAIIAAVVVSPEQRDQFTTTLIDGLFGKGTTDAIQSGVEAKLAPVFYDAIGRMLIAVGRETEGRAVLELNPEYRIAEARAKFEQLARSIIANVADKIAPGAGFDIDRTDAFLELLFQRAQTPEGVRAGLMTFTASLSSAFRSLKDEGPGAAIEELGSGLLATLGNIWNSKATTEQPLAEGNEALTASIEDVFGPAGILDGIFSAWKGRVGNVMDAAATNNFGPASPIQTDVTDTANHIEMEFGNIETDLTDLGVNFDNLVPSVQNALRQANQEATTSALIIGQRTNEIDFSINDTSDNMERRLPSAARTGFDGANKAASDAVANMGGSVGTLKDIIQSYIDRLNAIPREIITVVKIHEEGGGGSNPPGGEKPGEGKPNPDKGGKPKGKGMSSMALPALPAMDMGSMEQSVYITPSQTGFIPVMATSSGGVVTSGGSTTNYVTIFTNDADKLIEDLRRRGIDLKRMAR